MWFIVPLGTHPAEGSFLMKRKSRWLRIILLNETIIVKDKMTGEEYCARTQRVLNTLLRESDSLAVTTCLFKGAP